MEWRPPGIPSDQYVYELVKLTTQPVSNRSNTTRSPFIPEGSGSRLQTLCCTWGCLACLHPFFNLLRVARAIIQITIEISIQSLPPVSTFGSTGKVCMSLHMGELMVRLFCILLAVTGPAARETWLSPLLFHCLSHKEYLWDGVSGWDFSLSLERAYYCGIWTVHRNHLLYALHNLIILSKDLQLTQVLQGASSLKQIRTIIVYFSIFSRQIG